MKLRGTSLLRSITVVAACCAGVLCSAAAVPAWLDDAVSKWNAANPETQIHFVDIKDSFVWYDMPRTSDLGHQQIRERINNLVLSNGYEPTDDEELITTGRPPAATGGRSTDKKCWSRSFVLNINAQGNTKGVGESSSGQQQRLLTNLVCEDSASWWAAFRVAG